MKCPFCAEEIRDEAVVCRHCRRDLSIVRPVMDQLKALATRIESLEADAKTQAERVKALETGSSAETREATAEDGGPVATRDEPASGSGFGSVTLALATPILALLVTHWLLVMVFDLKLWAIRFASLAVPFAIAMLVPLRGGHRVAIPALAGLFIGGASVLGMMTITGLMDDQPIWPQDRREWREVIEYGVSMWLSYMTGALVVSWLRGRQTDSATQSTVRKLAQDLARLTAPENESRQQLEKRIQTLAGTIGTMVPVVTAAGSIIAGLRKLWE